MIIKSPREGMWKHLQDWDETLLRFELQVWTRVGSYFASHCEDICMTSCYSETFYMKETADFWNDFNEIQGFLIAFVKRIDEERLAPLYAEWERRGFKRLSVNEYYLSPNEYFKLIKKYKNFPASFRASNGIGEAGDPIKNLMFGDYLRELKEQKK